MKFQHISTPVSFDDPESAFYFERSGPSVIISFHEWCGKKVAFSFFSVEAFGYSLEPLYPDVPEGCFGELLESEKVQELLKREDSDPNEVIRHFVMSTNEGEWCEVIAESYRVT